MYYCFFVLPQMRLGNSSRSPTIAGLILEHLCPTIQNILEDGLRDHKLDLIIGQRRNHSWNVVEVSTRIGTHNSNLIFFGLVMWWGSILHTVGSLINLPISITGPSTKVLHSLVSKIRQCPQFSSHCMRLRAFIMGLLK